MAKIYEIKLSEKNILVRDNIALRDAEIGILKSALVAKSAKVKSIKEYLAVSTLLDQVESLTDDSPALASVTDEDVAILKSGFELTAELGHRPLAWMKCSELLKRIESPIEVK